jgi:hypothetical protein
MKEGGLEGMTPSSILDGAVWRKVLTKRLSRAEGSGRPVKPKRR